MYMKVKYLLILMALLLSVTGSLAHAQDEEVELTFLVFETPNLNAEFWQAAVDRWVDEHPNYQINIIVSPDVDRNTYAKQLLATEQFPDLLIAIRVSEFVEAEALLPFSDEDLEPFMFPDVNLIDGKQYQLPMSGQYIPVIFYNKDIFAEVGVEVPQTWSEFIEVNEALLEAGHTPLLMGMDAWVNAQLLQGMVSTDIYSQQPDWLLQRRAGEVSFSDENFVAAVQKYQDLFGAGYFNEDMWSLGYADLEQAFLAGNSAMYPMGTWFIAATAGFEDFEIGAFPIPTEDGDNVLPVFAGGCMSVSASTEFPEEARAFAVDFCSSSANVDAFVQADALFPYVHGYEMSVEMPPLFAVTLTLLDDNRAVTPFGIEYGDSGMIPGISDAFTAMAQEVILGGDVEEQLEILDELWEETEERLGQ